MTLEQILPYLLPVLVLQIGLQIYSTINLVNPETTVKFNKKWIWAIVIWVLAIPGAIVYLLVGKNND